MSVIHKKHSTAVGSTDPSKVHPSDWNDEHVNADGTPVTGMRVIGPFHIAFDTPDLTAASGAVLETFDTDGAFLLSAIVVITTQWEGANAISMEVVAGGTNDYYPLWVFGDLRGIPANNSGAPSALDVASRPRLLSVGEIFMVDAYGVVGMTAGAADIYALIADPA